MEFAAATGISDPVAVEGVWKFAADGYVFGVTEDDSGNDLWIYGEIPAPSPDRENSFHKAVLEGNFFMRGTCGAVFSINPETGAYTLMKSMPLITATSEDFFALVEKFVNTLATWTGLANATQDASPDSATQDASPADASQESPGAPEELRTGESEDFSGMLRV